MLGSKYQSILAPAFSYRRARGMLAERRISQKALAEASGLSIVQVNNIMTGVKAPGELARIKLAWGLEKLGIDPAQVFDLPSASETKTRSVGE